jgi:hypothetical protein
MPTPDESGDEELGDEEPGDEEPYSRLDRETAERCGLWLEEG